MKPTKNTSNVRSKKRVNGFQPIYYFSRSVGLWPFTIIYNSNGSIKKARVCLFDILWFIASISLYLTAIFYTYDELNTLLNQNDRIFVSDILYHIFQIPLLFFGAVYIIIDMLNRKKLVNILRKFIMFDNEVRVLLKISDQ